jgi:hypothetical protein
MNATSSLRSIFRRRAREVHLGVRAGAQSVVGQHETLELFEPVEHHAKREARGVLRPYRTRPGSEGRAPLSGAMVDGRSRLLPGHAIRDPSDPRKDRLRVHRHRGYRSQVSRRLQSCHRESGEGGPCSSQSISVSSSGKATRTRRSRSHSRPLQAPEPHPVHGCEGGHAGGFEVSSDSEVCFAMCLKSSSVVSNCRPCRIHNWAMRVSIVPTWIPLRRQEFRSPAASMWSSKSGVMTGSRENDRMILSLDFGPWKPCRSSCRMRPVVMTISPRESELSSRWTSGSGLLSRLRASDQTLVSTKMLTSVSAPPCNRSLDSTRVVRRARGVFAARGVR